MPSTDPTGEPSDGARVPPAAQTRAGVTSAARRWGQLLGRVVVWAVLVVAVAVLLLFVLVPRLTGATPYTVLTGSMRPELPPGTLIVVRPAPFADIAAGDVVTYQLRPGEPAVVTHRVVAVEEVDGSPRLRTQGDANDAPDQALVQPEQLRGRLWYSAPYLGHVATALPAETRAWVVRVVGLGLVGYAVFLVSGGLARRRG